MPRDPSQPAPDLDPPPRPHQISARSPLPVVPLAALSAGHFVHDIFTSFLAPLLPLLISRYQLSLTLAGGLNLVRQIPSLLNPLIGQIADRHGLRWMVILTPSISAAGMCALGLAPAYWALLLALFVVGLSTAAWHVATPVLMAGLTPGRAGLAMSLYMLGGELARSVGPIIAVAAVGWWGLTGLWRILPVAFACSMALWLVLRPDAAQLSAKQTSATRSKQPISKTLRSLLATIAGVVGARAFVNAALVTFLPIYLMDQGYSLWQSTWALAGLELSAALGVLLAGHASDSLGRRQVLVWMTLWAPLLMLGFVLSQGWLRFVFLPLLGLSALAINPVLLALVQEHSQGQPATANGLFMLISFGLRALAVFMLGVMADLWGISMAFTICALISALGLPFALALPKPERLSTS